MVEESSDDSTEEGEPSPNNTVTVDGNRNSPKDKTTLYNCSDCEKSFSSPQALGGGHQMERMYQSHTYNSIGNGIEFLNNIAMGLGMNPSPSSFMQLPSSPTISPFQAYHTLMLVLVQLGLETLLVHFSPTLHPRAGSGAVWNGSMTGAIQRPYGFSVRLDIS
ncbi:hypothetical protein PIB30_076678 [Stylosanthes scabra]|uniref:C2H2-type domain-containing protein n=1 Tax=Stylosanthes scabra TaxID=79078 RepID=A0ABU6ZNX1_9FABA|nr:hypothetical protein [Stylosanthes scabra]